MQENNVEKIRMYAQSVTRDTGSHGFDHTKRVVGLCNLIGNREGARMDILIPAALLHDIARSAEKERGIPHEAEGAQKAEEFLGSIGYDPAVIPEISGAIRTHRFRSEEKPVSLEAKILSDADKLDAMGAVGIARTFIRAGEHQGTMEDAVGHFHDKLLRLHEHMYTGTAQAIAAERHEILVQFLRELARECVSDTP